MKKLLLTLAILALCLCAVAAYAGNTGNETVTVTVDPVNNLSVPLTGALELVSEDTALDGYYAPVTMSTQSAAQSGYIHHNDALNVYLTAQCTSPSGGADVGNDITLKVKAYTGTLAGNGFKTVASTAACAPQDLLDAVPAGATPITLDWTIPTATLALTHSGSYNFTILFTSQAN